MVTTGNSQDGRGKSDNAVSGSDNDHRIAADKSRSAPTPRIICIQDGTHPRELVFFHRLSIDDSVVVDSTHARVVQLSFSWVRVT